MKRISMSIAGAVYAAVALSAQAQSPSPASGASALIRSRPAVAAPAGDDVKGPVGSLSGRISGSTQLASQSELLSLGNVWTVNECCGWTGTWTRRAGTNAFSATWRHTNGTVVNDTVTLMEWNKGNNQVLLVRQGNGGTYRATYIPSARAVSAGSASWYPAGASWSATLR